MVEIPEGAKVPADRQKTAAQIEAEGIETIVVPFRDFEFTIAAAADDWEVETTLAFEDGKAANGVRGVLGNEQWAALMKTKPRNRDLSELFKKIAEALGLGDEGN